jgi:hypothetical protein
MGEGPSRDSAQQGGVPAKAEIEQNNMAFVGCIRGAPKGSSRSVERPPVSSAYRREKPRGG